MIFMMDSKVDVSRAALVVIDIQKGILDLDRKLEPNSASQVIANTAKLVESFRQAEKPVFLVSCFID